MSDRLTIRIAPRDLAWLKARAAETGVTLSNIVRDALATYKGEQHGESPELVAIRELRIEIMSAISNGGTIKKPKANRKADTLTVDDLPPDIKFNLMNLGK